MRVYPVIYRYQVPVQVPLHGDRRVSVLAWIVSTPIVGVVYRRETSATYL
jgi:hypothetical protein